MSTKEAREALEWLNNNVECQTGEDDDVRISGWRAIEGALDELERLRTKVGQFVNAAALDSAAIARLGSQVATLEARLNGAAEQVTRAVAELDDRDSPADWPEAMLVTEKELLQIVRQVCIEHEPFCPAEETP